MDRSLPRPRILIVTRNLPPLVGGMERLNWHMAAELAKAADVRIVGPAGATAMAPPDIEVREAPLKPLWRFLLVARGLARREARRWKPDILTPRAFKSGVILTVQQFERCSPSLDTRMFVWSTG